MESLPVLTVADLRAHSVMEWDQDVQLSFPLPGRPPLVLALASNLVVPVAVFKYQLQQAVYEGTCNGGVKWWCKKVAFTCGKRRKHKFDMSINFNPFSIVFLLRFWVQHGLCLCSKIAALHRTPQLIFKAETISFFKAN